MKNKKIYFSKVIYSIYVGLFMGFIITSGFLVIITNVDKYFFNSIIGIRGDWLYYISTIVLIPIFGFIYIYNKRIVIDNNILEIREKGYSFTVSKIDVSKLENISLHKQKRSKRRYSLGIMFEAEEKDIIIYIKPYSKYTLAVLIKDLIKINPNIIVDDYYLNILNSN